MCLRFRWRRNWLSLEAKWCTWGNKQWRMNKYYKLRWISLKIFKRSTRMKFNTKIDYKSSSLKIKSKFIKNHFSNSKSWLMISNLNLRKPKKSLMLPKPSWQSKRIPSDSRSMKIKAWNRKWGLSSTSTRRTKIKSKATKSWRMSKMLCL